MVLGAFHKADILPALCAIMRREQTLVLVGAAGVGPLMILDSLQIKLLDHGLSPFAGLVILSSRNNLCHCIGRSLQLLLWVVALRELNEVARGLSSNR